MIKHKPFSLLLLLFALTVSAANAQMAPAQIDTLVERTLKTFDVPGISVGIVKDGKLIFAKGYGVRSLATMKKMDENTLVGIASNSKAFTVAALAMLADEGKLKLDDKVTDYIPEFKMFDPYVTAEFTIRDLLTHRSGLGLGAGDLMIFPDSADFKVKDIIHNLRYLKPVSSFRSRYDYDNQMYIVAGEIVARVSGMSWEDFIETRIMQPLHMDKSAASYSRIKDGSDVSEAHAPTNGKVHVIGRYSQPTCDAAGGINSNIIDMSKWVIAQLDNGKYGDGKRLFSEKLHSQMWSPQTILQGGDSPAYNSHFAAYGLGFFLNDAKGYKEVSHTGGLGGMVTKVDMIPELKLGIIVLTNQESGAAFTAIANQIKDSYLGVNGRDWVKAYSDMMKQRFGHADSVTNAAWAQVNAQQQAGKKGEINIAGTYHDSWLGDANITQKGGKVWFSFAKAPKLTGEVLFYKGNTYVVKWNDRSFDADAYASFTTDVDGKPTGIKMAAISPATDFSFDFQDLELQRVN